MSQNQQNQLEHALASLNFLHPNMSDDYVVEMSASGVGGYAKGLWVGSAGGIASGWFSNLKLMASKAIDIDQGWLNNGGYTMNSEGIYVTVNPVTPALLSRSYNIISGGVKRSTDKDVVQYHNLFIDIDAERPAETSSSDDEKTAALEVVGKVKDYLVGSLAWPEPMIADSGNGYHLAFKSSIPVNKDNVALIKQLYLLLNDTFCNAPYFVGDEQIKVKVDSVVHNPSRLIKLHGTTARKGMPTPTRPQRQSFVISLPPLDQPVISLVTLESTVKILAEALGKEDEIAPIINTIGSGKPTVSSSPARRPGVDEMFSNVSEVTPIVQGGTLDVQRYLNDNGYKVRKIVNAESDELPTLYVLERCLFDSSHAGKDAAIGQHLDGMLFYQCFHESCSSDPERSWPAARKIISGDAGLGQWMSGGSFGVAFPDINKEGKPYANYANFQALLAGYGIKLFYNEMTRRLDVRLPGNLWDTSDRRLRLTRALLISKCRKHGLGTADLDDWFAMESEENSVHPVKEMVLGGTWDGTSRLDELAATVTVPEKQKHLWPMYLRKWLISCVAALFHPHFSSKSVLTFTGPQNVGKTSWLRRLTSNVPDAFAEGVTLDPKVKDSVIGVIGHWIAELGELDATFRKADISRLKSFISNKEDLIRVPYAKDHEIFKRQTVFAATVNDPQFLVDGTGNSRWWAVTALYINYMHDIDMQQVWAEVFELYCSGEAWHLTPEESDIQTNHNKQYEVVDPVEEKIRECFKFETPRSSWVHMMTATQVLEKCGYRQPNRSITTKAGNFLIQAVGVSERKRVTSMRGKFYCMPDERSVFEAENEGHPGDEGNIIAFDPLKAVK